LAAGLATLAWIRQAEGMRPPHWPRWSRPNRSLPASGSPLCSIRYRPSGRGCCWPKVMSRRQLSGRPSVAWVRRTRRTTRARGRTWCWHGC
jgi:hypothetical protein